MNHPEVVDRLAILNAAHPRRLSEGLQHPSQLRKSWYSSASRAGAARGRGARDDGTSSGTSCATRARRTPGEEIDRYIEAWSQPGAAAGMINDYRASVRQSQKEAVANSPARGADLVIWGERDSYLGSDLAEPERDDVPDLDRVERCRSPSHAVITPMRRIVSRALRARRRRPGLGARPEALALGRDARCAPVGGTLRAGTRRAAAHPRLRGWHSSAARCRVRTTPSDGWT